ncbi:MAG: hypothetical protein LBI60_06760 [Bacteroidales bacterium]|jgi:hypothetical protein|nr:hypothetical protein [Bacteroidales bacterium]
MSKIISETAIANRDFWIRKIQKSSGSFSNDSDCLDVELAKKIEEKGVNTLRVLKKFSYFVPEA